MSRRTPAAARCMPALADGSLPTVNGVVEHPEHGRAVLLWSWYPHPDKLKDQTDQREWRSTIRRDRDGRTARVRTIELHPTILRSVP